MLLIKSNKAQNLWVSSYFLRCLNVCIGLLKHYEVKLYICLVVLLLLVVPNVKQSSCWSFQPYLWQNTDCICRCLRGSEGRCWPTADSSSSYFKMCAVSWLVEWFNGWVWPLRMRDSWKILTVKLSRVEPFGISSCHRIVSVPLLLLYNSLTFLLFLYHSFLLYYFFFFFFFPSVLSFTELITVSIGCWTLSLS